MQVYQGMDIGTAKPTGDVRSRIPHYMVDIIAPSAELSVKEYQQLGRSAIDEALSDHGKVIIAGGSGLHFRALVDPLTFAPSELGTRTRLEAEPLDELCSRLVAIDESAGAHIDMDNPRRVVRALEIYELTGDTPSSRASSTEARAIAAYVPEVPFVGFGVDTGDTLKDSVEARFHAMLEAGLLEEVRGLEGSLGATASQAVGYKELMPVVRGEEELGDATTRAVSASRSLVKRQRTYFRRDPRITWLPWQDGGMHDVDAAVRAIKERVAWTS